MTDSLPRPRSWFTLALGGETELPAVSAMKIAPSAPSRAGSLFHFLSAGALLFVIGISLSISSLAAAAADKAPRPTLKAAESVLRDSDNVRASSRVDEVFRWAAKLEQDGKTAESVKFVEAGLRLAPFRLDQQIVAAELLLKSRQTNAARERASIVWQRAETDELLAAAAGVLGLSATTNSSVTTWPEQGPALGLVPLGPVDLWLLRALQTELGKALQVPVVILPAITNLPAADRPPGHLLAAHWRKWFRDYPHDPVLVAKARKLQLNPQSIPDNEDVFRLVSAVLESEDRRTKGTNLVAGFERDHATLNRLGSQWRADALLEPLALKHPEVRRPGRALLGVTRIDLFNGENRFVFGVGSAEKRAALFSYLRFTAAANDTAPNSAKLLERARKQSLSSTGFALGIPRCSSPLCARAYPNSLDELDAKGSDLCDACARGFRWELAPR
jgi:predicted Zn-dependent protease